MTKRRFPHNTCPASRHVEMLADQLLDSGRSAMIESEPENCAVSMHSTVEALYGARDRIEQLERVLVQAREALEIGLENASQIAGEYHSAMSGYKQNRHDALDSDVDATKQAIAAIDEALNHQASG